MGIVADSVSPLPQQPNMNKNTIMHRLKVAIDVLTEHAASEADALALRALREALEFIKTSTIE